MTQPEKIIVIVGVGALGSHVVQFCRSLAGCRLIAIDHDRIEQKNISAQFHGKPSIGKSKVEALKQNMNFLFGVKIDGIPHKLTKDNPKELLGDAFLVVDCLDNAASRKIVQDYVRENRIPCVHGALAAAGAFGRVVWDLNFWIDEAGVGAATCEGGEHLPFIALVSSLLARSVQQFVLSGRRVGYEITTGGVIVT